VFLGAGSAGIGVADLIARIISLHENIPIEQARKQFWLVDSQGLVTTTRGGNLAEFKKPFARTDSPKEMKTLLEIIQSVKPTALVGLSGTPKSFDEASLREMAKLNDTPIIFALSNPTSKCECSAEEAFTFTDGKCLFAAGSPFDPVIINGKTYETGQGNNMYIFPGLGFGAVLSKATKVTDDMIVNAARALAEQVSPEELKQRKIYPNINKIREISAHVAVATIQTAYAEGVAQLDPKPTDLLAYVKSHMFNPRYRTIGASSKF
jgi:malate dehydrogenase (oxaloacetate-decarboxylating)(NADP+)